jgi:hypothetical protein
MEVVVSAAVLLLVVLGVMAGLDAVAGTAGANKARTVAATLAEKDQEELRSLMTVDLNRIESVIPGPRTVEVDGVPYTIVSDADLVSDVGGKDISCALDDGEGSYVRITSKVTSPMTGAKVKPVVITSIVAPEPGSGALVARVVNAKDDPVQNLPVQAIGPDTKTKTTNDAGCAVFGAVTAGAYEVKVSQLGWVDPDGDQEVIKNATVSAGSLTMVDFVYDVGATLHVNVQSAYGGPPAVAQTDDSYGIIAAHTGISTRYRLFPGAAPTRAATHTLNGLFPFGDGDGIPDDAYKIYSGRCTDQDPTQFRGDYFDVYTAAAPELTPGEVRTITILEPPVNINATFNTGLRDSHVYAYPRNGTCDNPLRYDMGVVQATGRAERPGLPFGSYEICAQFRDSSWPWRWYHHRITGVVNDNVDGGNATPHRIDVTTTSTQSTCPLS